VLQAPPHLTLVNTCPFFLPYEKVRAGTTAVGQEEEVFLDITAPVWTPATASESTVVGQHTFPFSITLPRHATLAPVPQAAPKSFLLPPTFSERASPAYIDYRLFVTVRRGRLRVDKECVFVLQCHHRLRPGAPHLVGR
jgi:Arrestin (or S-antigen), N-terminal domain